MIHHQILISLGVLKITLYKKWLHILTLPNQLCRKLCFVCMVPIWIWSQKWLKLSQKVTNLCSLCRLGNVTHIDYSLFWDSRSSEKMAAKYYKCDAFKLMVIFEHFFSFALCVKISISTAPTSMPNFCIGFGNGIGG